MPHPLQVHPRRPRQLRVRIEPDETPQQGPRLRLRHVGHEAIERPDPEARVVEGGEDPVEPARRDRRRTRACGRARARARRRSRSRTTCAGSARGRPRRDGRPGRARHRPSRAKDGRRGRARREPRTPRRAARERGSSRARDRRGCSVVGSRAKPAAAPAADVERDEAPAARAQCSRTWTSSPARGSSPPARVGGHRAEDGIDLARVDSPTNVTSTERQDPRADGPGAAAPASQIQIGSSSRNSPPSRSRSDPAEVGRPAPTPPSRRAAAAATTTASTRSRAVRRT